QQPKIPFVEILKSIPEVFGIRLNEEPEYKVLKKDGPVEVRQYSSQLHAKVTLKGLDFDTYRNKAFELLAAYIFGANSGKTKMAMTSPVLQKNDSEKMAMTSPVLQQQSGDQEWTMTFILPSKYSLASVPKPDNPQIKIVEEPGYEAVTLRYTGTNSLQSLKKHEDQLSAWLLKNPQYKVNGKFFAAQYDAPFAVPFLRRNEVLAKVTSAH
ncbi:MAG: heme-binding protein, partial [Bdellovibrionota bacterium]